MNYEDWLDTVPEEITSDSLWKMNAYRLALKGRAQFYEYALGSARESRDWYYKGRHVLGETVAMHRIRLLTQIIRLLLTMVPQQRGRALREEHLLYQADMEPVNREELDKLLQNVPMPIA